MRQLNPEAVKCSCRFPECAVCNDDIKILFKQGDEFILFPDVQISRLAAFPDRLKPGRHFHLRLVCLVCTELFPDLFTDCICTDLLVNDQDLFPAQIIAANLSLDPFSDLIDHGIRIFIRCAETLL